MQLSGRFCIVGGARFGDCGFARPCRRIARIHDISFAGARLVLCGIVHFGQSPERVIGRRRRLRPERRMIRLIPRAARLGHGFRGAGKGIGGRALRLRAAGGGGKTRQGRLTGCIRAAADMQERIPFVVDYLSPVRKEPSAVNIRRGGRFGGTSS